MSSLAPQVARENSRGTAVTRAVCDNARDAVVFVYCERAFVSVLCVCLAARRIGRRRKLAITALWVCNDRAQVARATFVACHPYKKCGGHLLARAIAGASRAARARFALRVEARPTRSYGMARAPQFTYFPRGSRANGLLCGGAALGFRYERTC